MALKIKRGHGAPSELLKEGEPYLDLDTGEMYMGNGVENVKYVKDNGAKVYRAILTQNSTNAPVATIIENGLTDLIVWRYEGVGIYSLQSGDFVDSNKILLNIERITDDPFSYANFNYNFGYYLEENKIFLLTAVNNTLNNNLLIGNPFEVIVYP